MKYIIIGIAMLYIAIPAAMAWDFVDDISEFWAEWRECFKEFAPLFSAVLAEVAAAGFMLYGLVDLLTAGAKG